MGHYDTERATEYIEEHQGEVTVKQKLRFIKKLSKHSVKFHEEIVEDDFVVYAAITADPTLKDLIKSKCVSYREFEVSLKKNLTEDQLAKLYLQSI